MSGNHPGRKQKIKHELWEMTWLFLYLLFFFFALAAYNFFLLKQYELASWNFGFAALNALIITKVIMIGEYAKLGTRHEDKGLLVSAVWKAFIFSLLVFAFHVLEEIIKLMIHGADLARASTDIRMEQLASRAIIVFSTFLPLFAFRELRRVIGEDQFNKLVLGTDKGEAAVPQQAQPGISKS